MPGNIELKQMLEYRDHTIERERTLREGADPNTGDTTASELSKLHERRVAIEDSIKAERQRIADAGENVTGHGYNPMA
jgi:hypothetical protein